ncbi:cupredoxin domain-containing protein [Microbulbifer variabilis]|uniref:cupredoxin domain-containing protein n=1 Tax=Microbulbifer variabilis TaxID=266805 RepID=UPI001CFDF19F|nr:cupredoxin domain-containing protein [Microbulbifer variabilis]
MTERSHFYWQPLLLLTILGFFTLSSSIAQAARPQFEIEIRGHLFYPSELTIPANIKVKLIVHNQDPTPEEFESYELNREKVIMGGQKAVIFIGPLAPGVYPFFGEFNPKTAQGKIVAQGLGESFRAAE